MQHLQVVADRGLGQVERSGQVTDARLAARMRGDQRHQPQPDRIGERLQQRRDLLGLRPGQRLDRQRRAARRRIGRAQHRQRTWHASILTGPDVCGKLGGRARYRRSSKSKPGRFSCPAACSSPSTSATWSSPSPSIASCLAPSLPSGGPATPTSPSLTRRSSSSCWSTPARAAPQPPRRRGRRRRHRRRRAGPARRGRARSRRRAGHHLLLRPAGQVLGPGRTRRRVLGDLHRPGRQPDLLRRGPRRDRVLRHRRPPAGRSRRHRRPVLLAGRPRVRRLERSRAACAQGTGRPVAHRRAEIPLARPAGSADGLPDHLGGLAVGVPGTAFSGGGSCRARRAGCAGRRR